MLGDSEGVATGTGAEDAAFLADLNRKIPDWEQQRDPAAIRELEAVLAADLIFRRADGTIVERSTFVTTLTQPSPFEERWTEALVVEVCADQALVISTVGTRAHGEERRFRNLRVFVRRDGRWLLTVWFNDELPAPDGSGEVGW